MSEDLLSIYLKGKHEGRQESAEKLKAYQKDHERLDFLVNHAGLSRQRVDKAMEWAPFKPNTTEDE
jgi:hypothetical protein